MTAARLALIEATIAGLQAAGVPISNAAVYAAVRGNKTDLSTYMAAWRAQQRAASTATVPEAGAQAVEDDGEDGGGAAWEPVVVRTTRAPVPRLEALAWQYSEAQRNREAAEQRVQALARAQQEARFAAREALRQLRQASLHARTCQPHEMQAAMRAAAAAEQGLAAYVGEEEAARAGSDMAYVPQGL